MKRILVLLFSVFLTFSIIGGASASVITFDDSNLSGWYRDRFDPATFETAVFDGDNRLHIGISGNDQQTNSFYNYQGKKYDFGDDIYTYGMVGDLYVDADWDTGNWNVGMWGTTVNDNDVVSGYPMIVYRNSDTVTAGFYGFDYYNGGWFSVMDVTEFDKWYSLKMVYNKVALNYFIDGDNVKSFADTYEHDNISNIILNSYNFGQDYDVYWDNVGTAIPEPATLLLFGVGLLGIAGVSRRRKA